MEFSHRVDKTRTERNEKMLGKVISISLTLGKALK